MMNIGYHRRTPHAIGWLCIHEDKQNIYATPDQTAADLFNATTSHVTVRTIYRSL